SLALRALVPFGPTNFARDRERLVEPRAHDDRRPRRRRVAEEQLGGGAPVAEAAHLVDRLLAVALGLAAEARLLAQRAVELLHASRAEPRAHALRMEQRALGEAERLVRIAGAVDELGLRAQDAPERLGAIDRGEPLAEGGEVDALDELALRGLRVAGA